MYKKYSIGFTLVELIVVISVIGILSSIVSMSYVRYQVDARDVQRSSRATLIAAALEKYYSENGEYPSCADMTKSLETVQTTILKGIDSNILVTPQSAATTNSVICKDLTTDITDDVFAYVGDASTACSTGTACPEWKLKYREEASGNVIVIDSRHKVDVLTPTSGGVITLFAGNTSYTGTTDATGGSARFNTIPTGISADSSGNIYVADTNNHRIRKITPTGVVTTLAGSTAGNIDGTGTNARFYYPSGIDVDSTGNVYVADTFYGRIRKVTPEGVVTTIAGSTTGYLDATGTSARFNKPEGLALDSDGNIYVADTLNRRIRKITPTGVVTTLAGSSEGGYLDATGTNAQFSSPHDVIVDSSNNVYVSDQSNNRIRKITSAGVVTTLVGSTAGYTDTSGTAAQFSKPYGLDIDESNNLYVADYSNEAIRKISPTGVTTTIAGGSMGTFAGVTENPRDVTITSSGTVYFVPNSGAVFRLQY